MCSVYNAKTSKFIVLILLVSNGTQDKKPRSTTDKSKHKSRSKSSTGGNSVVDSPTKRRSDGSKQSKYSVDSPRGLNKSNLGDDQSTCSNPAGVPKSSRQKKSKGSEGPSKALISSLYLYFPILFKMPKKSDKQAKRELVFVLTCT